MHISIYLYLRLMAGLSRLAGRELILLLARERETRLSRPTRDLSNNLLIIDKVTGCLEIILNHPHPQKQRIKLTLFEAILAPMKDWRRSAS